MLPVATSGLIVPAIKTRFIENQGAGGTPEHQESIALLLAPRAALGSLGWRWRWLVAGTAGRGYGRFRGGPVLVTALISLFAHVQGRDCHDWRGSACRIRREIAGTAATERFQASR